MSGRRRLRRVARFRKRRRRLTALVAVLALVVGIPLVLGVLPVKVGPLETVRDRVLGEARQSAVSQDVRAGADAEEMGSQGTGGDVDGGESGHDGDYAQQQISAIQPSPASAAYAAVAPALPEVEASNVGTTFQSTDDPSWAVTEIAAPNRDDPYTVYSKKAGGGWESRRSVFANNPDYPEKGRAPLMDLPQDLQDALYPESTAGPGENPQEAARKLVTESSYLGEAWRPVSLRGGGEFAKVRLEKKGSDAYTYVYLRRFEGSWYVLCIGRSLTAAELPNFPEALVEPGSLPEAGPAKIPAAEPVLEDVSRDRRDRVEKGLGKVRDTVEDYEGAAGVYVRGSGEEWGYGIRPDERFYTASVIKIPVMAAVYEKIEAGELSLSDTVATKDRDYAGGAGGLQWQEDSVSHTIGDYLWMMIKQSDNVATNVLVRTVGGSGYVNEVAGDLGAEETELQNKVTDQRAAAPGLDNYTTPRDMANVLEAISTGEVAGGSHKKDMLGLMKQTRSDSWLGRGLPAETEAACKVGWIGGVYNEVCLVQAGDEPYVISVFSKYGPEAVGEGSSMLEEISSKVWEIQEGEEDRLKDDKSGE